jgi:hypothetical protein
MAASVKIRLRGFSDGYGGSRETCSQHVHLGRVKINYNFNPLTPYPANVDKMAGFCQCWQMADEI